MTVLRTLPRFVAIGMLFVLASPIEAATPNLRLELGRRLKRFEQAWEQAPAELRSASASSLQVAVRSFFSLQLREAGRHLDEAWLTVQGDSSPDGLIRGLIGLQLTASPVCTDTESASLDLKLEPFYPTAAVASSDAVAILTLTSRTGERLKQMRVGLSRLSAGLNWTTGPLPEGDHVLTVTIRHTESVFNFPPMTISRIARLNDRLAQLEKALTGLKRETGSAEVSATNQTIIATLRNEIQLMSSIMEERIQEADFPMLDRLRTCETLVESRNSPRRFPERVPASRQVWLSLAKGLQSVRTRIHVPENTADPVPVLFVFHGAGGSENMFFETYGAGRVIREAARRGWVVVSPSLGFFGLPLDISEMLDALENFVSLDRQRVMMLGHSMGASQAVQQVKKHPGLPVAVIALGGGGSLGPEDAKRVGSTAWLIGAGDQDFGRSAAQRLNRALADSAGTVRLKIYENVEHLGIVQASIDDSFRFLEQSLSVRSKNRKDDRSVD